MTDGIQNLDPIFKALSDSTRRGILDLLKSGPMKTSEIVKEFPDLSRFAVMKHLEVLRKAGTVITREDGRNRINSLNTLPIRELHENWIRKIVGTDLAVESLPDQLDEMKIQRISEKSTKWKKIKFKARRTR